MKPASVVVMGVSGCGKSSLAREIANALSWPMVEGDDFHGPQNQSRMAAGIALTDADRTAWLDALAGELARHPSAAVLSCSALKKRYRDLLRATRSLRFVYLEITPAIALERVRGRGAAHFFPDALVDSQFETLEPPHAEPGVLCLDGAQAPSLLVASALAWIHSTGP